MAVPLDYFFHIMCSQSVLHKRSVERIPKVSRLSVLAVGRDKWTSSGSVLYSRVKISKHDLHTTGAAINVAPFMENSEAHIND